MIKPISPDEILELKNGTIPDQVIETVNELLALDFVNRQLEIIVKQSDIKRISCQKLGIDTCQFVTEWLNFEPLYEEIGWKVKYDSPSYGDDYFEPHFSFKVRT